MQLTYLYVRSRHYELEKLQTDGHYELLRALVARGVVDRVRVVRESYAFPGDHQEIQEPGFEVSHVHDISSVTLDPGEVVWIRGGWKSWIPWIERHAQTHWIFYYGANTGHQSWPWWDVVLEDRHDNMVYPDRLGRLVWPFRKPIAPAFCAGPPQIPVWDVCVGASHIYDRKGQYRIIAVADQFQKLAGRPLRCVIPGCFYSRERHTEAMKALLRSGKYPYIHLPGMLPRTELVSVFQRSRFMYAATCGGQGDRCALEAGACGCRLIASLRKNHAPYVTEDYAFVPSHPDKTDELAEYLAEELNKPDPDRQEIAKYHDQNGGREAVIANLLPVLTHCLRHRKDRESLANLVPPGKEHF